MVKSLNLESGHVCCRRDGSLCCPLQTSPLPSKQTITLSKIQLPGKAVGVFLLAIVSELEAKCLKEPSVSHWIKHEQGCQVKKAGDGLSMEIIQFFSGQFLTYFPCVSAYMLCWSRICASKFSERFTEALSKGKKYSLWRKLRAKFMTCLAWLNSVKLQQG